MNLIIDVGSIRVVTPGSISINNLETDWKETEPFH